jgi:hypothetical protein
MCRGKGPVCPWVNTREEYDGFMEKIGVPDLSTIFFSETHIASI